jgi:hypothetical protein
VGAVVGVTVTGTVVDIAVVDDTSVVLTAVDETGKDTVLVEAGATPSSELEQAVRKLMTANVTPNARRLIILASLKGPIRSAHSDVRTLARRLS